MTTSRKHNHVEAFCLMTYADKEGKEEVIWNSRDGVTPFVLYARSGKGEMQHVRWHEDQYAPYHVPDIGSRIFVSMTWEKAKEYAERRISNLNRKEIRATFGSREKAIARIADSIYVNGEAPLIVEVDQELHQLFKARAKREGWMAHIKPNAPKGFA